MKITVSGSVRLKTGVSLKAQSPLGDEVFVLENGSTFLTETGETLALDLRGGNIFLGYAENFTTEDGTPFTAENDEHLLVVGIGGITETQLLTETDQIFTAENDENFLVELGPTGPESILVTEDGVIFETEDDETFVVNLSVGSRYLDTLDGLETENGLKLVTDNVY